MSGRAQKFLAITAGDDVKVLCNYPIGIIGLPLVIRA